MGFLVCITKHFDDPHPLFGQGVKDRLSFLLPEDRDGYRRTTDGSTTRDAPRDARMREPLQVNGGSHELPSSLSEVAAARPPTSGQKDLL